jgi:hypothetical protein
MTDSQIYQVFGIGLFVAGLSWLINPKAFERLIKDLARNRGALLAIGIGTYVAGYLIITLHETKSIFINILGWVAFIKGLVVIVLSSTDIGFSKFFAKLKAYYSVVPWLVAMIGALALCVGYLV